MPNTYTLIEKITVGAAGASSIDFTSIPQTYTDLVVKASIRTSQASGPDYVYLQFNNNTSTSNYQGIILRGNGSTVASASNTAEGKIRAAISTTSGETASTFSNCEIYIPNYTSSNNKSISSDWVPENNATATFMGITAGLWTQTSAITSINLSTTSGSFVQYSTFYLYGVAKEGVSPSTSSAPYATGGDSIVFDGTYWIHTFTSSGTFTPKKDLTCDYLVVAGGGGGGSETGSALTSGGGGAGGMRCTVTGTGGSGSLESALSLTANTNYTVTVGAGGAVPSWPSRGNSGSNSVFSTITSTGGGGGGAYNTNKNGGSGGSGGGASHPSGTGGTASPSGQGYAGGDGSSTDLEGASGGGGGASAVGSNASVGSQANGGAGGAGRATNISGSSVTYAGGGGGGSTGANAASGGSGGGGTGAKGSAAGTAGTANLGGGGGGGANYSATSRPGGQGGSGIVIVRYAA